jgi:hypothetical protein
VRRLLIALAGGGAVVILAVSPALGGGGSPGRPTPVRSTSASEPRKEAPAPPSTRKEDPPEAKPRPVETTKAPREDERKQPTDVERLRLACEPGHRDDQPFVACKWSPSQHPDFAGYVLRRGDGEERTDVFRTRERDQTTYLDRDVQLGRTYVYLVEAIAAEGAVIGRSEPVKVSVGRPPLGDMRLACEPVRSDRGPTVACRWSAVDRAAGYRLMRTDRETRVIVCRVEAGGRTGCIDESVSPGATYAYFVEAVSRDGEVIARGGPAKVVIPG